MVSQEVFWVVTPAKAGAQSILEYLDSGFCRNDEQYGILASYESIKTGKEAFGHEP